MAQWLTILAKDQSLVPSHLQWLQFQRTLLRLYTCGTQTWVHAKYCTHKALLKINFTVELRYIFYSKPNLPAHFVFLSHTLVRDSMELTPTFQADRTEACVKDKSPCQKTSQTHSVTSSDFLIFHYGDEWSSPPNCYFLCLHSSV